MLNVHIYSMVAIFLVVLKTSTTAGHRADKNRREWGHVKHCELGQYVAHSHRKHHQHRHSQSQDRFENNDEKKRYNRRHCEKCTVCEEGVEVLLPCYRDQDTVCGDCINPDYVYNKSIQSCQPKEVSTIAKAEKQSGKQYNDRPKKEEDKYLRRKIIMAVVTLSVVLTVIILTMFTVIRYLKRNEQTETYIKTGNVDFV
ncbi:uncharacterized protein LOC144448307 [Glandiceps talaboti]